MVFQWTDCMKKSGEFRVKLVSALSLYGQIFIDGEL